MCRWAGRKIKGDKQNDEGYLTLEFLSSCYAAAVIPHGFLDDV